MSRVPPSDPNAYESRTLPQPHLISGRPRDPQWHAPVRYVFDNRRRVLLPVLLTIAACFGVILFVVMQSNRAIKQSEVLSHATSRSVRVVKQDVNKLAEKQDASDTKLARVDGQVQSLRKRVTVHDGAIKDLKGRASLPPDYNSKIPLTRNAKVHQVSSTVQDWNLRVEAVDGRKARIEVAPLRVTSRGTEVYAMKGNSSVPVVAGEYYLVDSVGRLTKSR